MNLAHVLADDILPRVEKPSRYLGNEINSVHKSPGRVAVRLALCFPDLYDIGLGNLGLHILYAILNRRPDVWAERVYAPAKDLEAELRRRRLPMFGWESKDSLDQFDGIGFTLQSELTFTNILNVIDLAGMPLRTSARREHDPLTFAGGPAVFNPEPLAPFMDFFVVGDGEEVVEQIADVFRDHRSRSARLRALADVDGVYVPALYPMETLPDGRIVPPLDAPPIRKRTVDSLDGASFPVDTIVPFTEQVHDRVSLEVLRGCTQGCRFCQAGMTTRPVRERTIDNLGQLMERTLASTGYEEVSLVSLSTCDYSRVRSLVQRAVEVAHSRHTSVSLPSLRLDSFSVEVADMVADTRRTGLTFAPEAASPRLRAVINKWIPDEELLEMAGEAYARGWDHVKLYFMIGLPTERDDDILAIADLCRRTVEVGRRHNRRASVRTGVSTFVPKPLTPFQWAAQIDADETQRRQRLLMDQFKRMPAVKFGRHHPEETFLEGLVSRSDRRAADLIEAAFQEGARFDAWSEHLDFAAWQRAIARTGFDTADALRARDPEERLPWDHIDIHVPKRWFQDDWARAMVLEHAQDCRHSKCHRCGVIDVKRPLCASMLRGAIAGAKADAGFVRTPLPDRPAGTPAMRVRFRVGRAGSARMLSHLEMARAWQRAMRRAGFPLAYSEGFHPLPKVNFSTALPVGEESTAEYMDVWLMRRGDPGELNQRLKIAAPDGFLVMGAVEVPLNAAGLMGLVDAADYVLTPVVAPETVGALAGDTAAADRLVDQTMEGVLAASSLPTAREGKAGPLTVDIRPMIRFIRREDGGAIVVGLQHQGGRPGKIREILALLGLDPVATRVVRRDVYVRAVQGDPGSALRSPAEGMVEVPTEAEDIAGAAKGEGQFPPPPPPFPVSTVPAFGSPSRP